MNNYLKLKEVHEIAIKHGFYPKLHNPHLTGEGEHFYPVYFYEKGDAEFMFVLPSFYSATTGSVSRIFVPKTSASAYNLADAIVLIERLAGVVQINPDGNDAE
jgi:hypothetical protein